MELTSKLRDMFTDASIVDGQVKKLEKEIGGINLQISKSNEEDSKRHAEAVQIQKDLAIQVEQMSESLSKKKDELRGLLAILRKNGIAISDSAGSGTSISA